MLPPEHFPAKRISLRAKQCAGKMRQIDGAKQISGSYDPNFAQQDPARTQIQWFEDYICGASMTTRHDVSG